ncbi:MAG TPA: hypothetical protein VMA96_04100 [Solirubrobacteraceae bacterium]|nr:hypothetical protein [Solirubrobacteraceae bacterium]
MHRSLSLLCAVAAIAAAISMAFGASSALARSHPASYVAGTPVVDTVSGTAANPAPWTLSQGDPTVGSPYNRSLPTFEFGGNPLGTFGGTSYPNLSVYPGSGTDVAGAPAGVNPAPYDTGFAGTPGPLSGYCTSGGPNPETGAISREPAGAVLPMSPYYFPFIMRNPNDPRVLTGFFDYRPKDTDEALVVANSFDGGKSWHFVDEKLELNPNNCGDLIQNDNGEGHAFVTKIGGAYYLYMLNRVSGDTLGQGLLVHKLNFGPSRSNPLGDPIASLPATEPVDAGPNPVNPVQGSLGYDDAVQPSGPAQVEIAPPSTSGTSGTGLSGGKVQVEVVPNYQTNPSGGVNISVSSIAPFSGVTGDPGGELVDIGSASAVSELTPNVSIHCAGGDTNGPVINGNGGAELTGCLAVNAFGAPGQQTVTLNPGDNLAAFPEVPDTALVTDPATEGNPVGPGLQAPDGVIGTFPARHVPGAPRNSTVLIYGEKIVNYWDPATINAKKSVNIVLSSSTPVDIPVTSLGWTGTGPQSVASLTNGNPPSASNPLSGIQLGYDAASPSSVPQSGIVSVSCSGQSATELLGCTVPSLPAGDTSVTTVGGYTVGAPGACNAPSAALQATGEGSTNPKTLFKNNEDYTVIRAAWTTDGINFHDLGIVNDINDPAYQGNAGDTTTIGSQAGTDQLRFVASRGTIVSTIGGRSGEETMFMSGADCQDGDSDSFQQVFYSTSTNGFDWTTPVPLLTTDPTFSASAEQEANLAKGIDSPLGVSAYYEGRVYDPTVVQDWGNELTMVFSGYRTAKPLPSTGSAALPLGTNPALTYTPGATDPALYRTILTVTVHALPGGDHHYGGWGHQR